MISRHLSASKGSPRHGHNNRVKKLVANKAALDNMQELCTKLLDICGNDYTKAFNIVTNTKHFNKKIRAMVVRFLQQHQEAHPPPK